MAAKYIIVLFKKNKLIDKYWTNIKDCCNDNNLPYWTIMRLPKPVKYKDFKIIRLEK